VIPRLTLDRPKTPAAKLWSVYMDFGACDLAAELIRRVGTHTWGLTANAGLNVRVTTVLPNVLPNYYTVVVFSPEKELSRRPGKPAHSGDGPYRNPEELHYSNVEVCTGGQDPEWTGAIVAHELGHAFTGGDTN
jgi:hypothetical protein